MNLREMALAIALGDEGAWRRIDTARDMLRIIEVGYLDDPPESFDLRDEFLNLIDEKDDKLRAWIKTTELGCRRRPYRAHMRKDITVSDEKWRRLMGGAWLVWRVAMDDHEMRYDPNKPKRLLEDNYGDEESFDYGDMAGVGLEDWDAWWREVYHAPPGRRWPGPSLGPLYEVFLLVRKWWIESTGKSSFRPSYICDPIWKDGRPVPDHELYNAPGRLFLAVAQTLDGRYTIANCETVYDKWRKRRRK